MAEPAQDGHAARTGPVLLALVAGQLGMHAAMAGLRMAAPLQTLREGASPWAVGLLLALFAAAPVLIALPAGRLADRLGYHRPVYLAVALSVAGGLLAIASTQVGGGWRFALLCGGAMATGSGTNIGLLTIQRSAGLAARDNTERVRIFAWLGVAPPLANVIGPVSAGFVIDAWGFGAAFALLALLPLATLVSARYVPRLAPAATVAVPPGRRAWDLLQAPGIKRLFVVNWLLSMCWDVHTFAVPVLGHELGFRAATIGLILGSFTLSVTLVRAAIPALAHRLSEVLVLRVAMAATGAVFALYPFATLPWVMGLLALLLGLSLGSVQPMVMSMLHQLTPEHRHGESLALRSMLMNMSSAAMPLLFGAVGTLVGASLLFWAVGAAVVGGSWLASGLAPPEERR
ncbi:MFS transporter [Rubrivivax sp. A210]|uniref:MFS transporter n=1 Tax=Rubrivivax sp. A210 TaxID=2772301 RepID=UPI00191AC1C4|nr:MFS transporter [Rubrivivax sp. A210]CAD5366462.1 MFS transporter [Rubrivivax sp. A210]